MCGYDPSREQTTRRRSIRHAVARTSAKEVRRELNREFNRTPATSRRRRSTLKKDSKYVARRFYHMPQTQARGVLKGWSMHNNSSDARNEQLRRLTPTRKDARQVERALVSLRDGSRKHATNKARRKQAGDKARITQDMIFVNNRYKGLRR